MLCFSKRSLGVWSAGEVWVTCWVDLLSVDQNAIVGRTVGRFKWIALEYAFWHKTLDIGDRKFVVSEQPLAMRSAVDWIDVVATRSDEMHNMCYSNGQQEDTDGNGKMIKWAEKVNYLRDMPELDVVFEYRWLNLVCLWYKICWIISHWSV